MWFWGQTGRPIEQVWVSAQVTKRHSFIDTGKDITNNCLFWNQLPSQNSCVGALTINVTVFSWLVL